MGAKTSNTQPMIQGTRRPTKDKSSIMPVIKHAKDSSLEGIDIPVNLTTRADIRAAMQRVHDLRRHPHVLFSWDPEKDTSVADRRRHELALSLVMVQSLDAGGGDLESHVRAAHMLFIQNCRAPGEAITAGRRLLRSRMLTGATDVETFWLVAAFAYALAPIEDPVQTSEAYQYLLHAPFAVDPLVARRFASACRQVRHTHLEGWPLTYYQHLLEHPEQADAGARLLEAWICVTLKAQDLLEAVDKHPEAASASDISQAFILLAHHYMRIHADSITAREVIKEASRYCDEPAPFLDYLDTQIFDLPYSELYRFVKTHEDDKERIDTTYDYFVASDRIGLARRLVECELVFLLAPWHVGRIEANIHRAVRKVIAGADLQDPRVRDLSIRLALLHSRSRTFTEEAQHLVRRVAVLDAYRATSHAYGGRTRLRRELEDYLSKTDPRHLMERERALILDRWDEFSQAERRLLGAFRQWVAPRLASGTALPTENGTSPLLHEAFHHPGGNRRLERRVERWLRQAYRHLCSERWTAALVRRIETETAQPYSAIAEADPTTIARLSRRMAKEDIRWTLLSGIAGGLAGGPIGLGIEISGVVLASIRAATRIGACFGLRPGTMEGFEFALDALTMSISAEAEEGLAAWLIDQRPRVYRVGAIAAVHAIRMRLMHFLLQPRATAHEDGSQPFSPSAGQSSTRDIPHRGGGLPVLRSAGASTSRWKRIAAGAVSVSSAAAMATIDYLFVKEITEAAFHLAARRWVLTRHGLLAAPTPRPAPPDLETDTNAEDGHDHRGR